MSKNEIQGYFDEHLKVYNLTPHPVTFPAGYYCWIGSDEEPLPEGWERITANNGGSVLIQWVTLQPHAIKGPDGQLIGALRLQEQDEADNWTDNALGSVVTDWMPESPMGICVAGVHRNLVVPELPEPQKDVFYIVSLPFLMGLKAAGVERADMIAPDTGRGVIRGEDGQILKVTGFVRLS